MSAGITEIVTVKKKLLMNQLLKIFGAELVLTPGASGMKGVAEKAELLYKEKYRI